MFKLDGRAVNDVLVEWIGPVTGRNYNVAQAATPAPALVHIKVWGSGAVKLQHNNTFVFKAPGGDQNLHRLDKVPAETGWADDGAVVNEAAGYQTRTITVDPATLYLRVIVTTAGTGRVEVKSNWS